MKLKELDKRMNQINKRRHDIIRELDSLDSERNHLIRFMKSPKLRKLENIEVQKEMQVGL